MKRVFLLCLALLLMLAIPAAAESYTINVDGIWYVLNPDGTATLHSCRTASEELVIPEEVQGYRVTSIYPEAFRRNDTLQTIWLPDSITEIGESAFYDCEALVSVRLPAGLTVLRESTFDRCEMLRYIELPPALTTIEPYALAHCNSLASIVMPESVTTIGDRAFYDCDGLLNVSVPATAVDVHPKAFLQPDFGVKYLTLTTPVGSAAYNIALDAEIRLALPGSPLPAKDATLVISGPYQYYLLEDGTAQIIWFTGDEHHYDIPAELDGVPVTSIGCRAFAGCSLLHSVVIPEGVEHIGYWAFRACYKLRDVTLPASVQSIGFEAFNILDYAPYRQENVVLTFHTVEGSYAQAWAQTYPGP